MTRLPAWSSLVFGFDSSGRQWPRDKFLRWRTREQLTRFAADVRALAETAPNPAEIPAVTRDPNDDYLVALAHAAGANGLCSADADLRAVSGVTVWTPAELVRYVLDET